MSTDPGQVVGGPLTRCQTTRSRGRCHPPTHPQPSTLDAMAARTQVVVTTVGPYPAMGCLSWLPCAAAGTRLRRSDRRGDLHPGKHRPPSQRGHRHRRAHRAFVRIRFHPFGFHRLRALPARRARPGRSARRHQSRGALIRRRRVGRHRRLDAGAHAHGLYRSRGQAADEPSLHAVPRPSTRSPNSVRSRMCDGVAAARSRLNSRATGSGRS